MDARATSNRLLRVHADKINCATQMSQRKTKVLHRVRGFRTAVVVFVVSVHDRSRAGFTSFVKSGEQKAAKACNSCAITGARSSSSEASM